MVKNDVNLTVVEVCAGACGFVTLVKAYRTGDREAVIQLESECASIAALDTDAMCPINILDLVKTHEKGNRILEHVADAASHPSCPVGVAIIKAGEVALGLNVPASVRIEFKNHCDGV